jgi:Family of unknown function (DUF5996)
MPDVGTTHPWPALPLAPWRATRDLLHMCTQLMGKTLLALASPQNHWWHSALRVSARGLASPSPIYHGDCELDLELDLVDHVLAVRSQGRTTTLPLATGTMHAFFDEYRAMLGSLGVEADIHPTPCEVPHPIPFDRDDAVRQYDAASAHRFWQVLRRCDAALRALSNSFVGKQSPVHFFWGSFDLAATRFSGRRAAERPGVDRVTREAYSHEVISFGFWPGGALPSGDEVGEPMFYAYAAPEPEGFREARVRPEGARYDSHLGEFLLPYELVRSAGDPVAEVQVFCEDVYAAGATLGGWDRDALERAPPVEPHPVNP